MKKERIPDEKLIRKKERPGRQIADPERSARGQEKRLAHLASFPELNPNPVLEVDSAGILLYLNPAAKKMFPDLENLGIRHPWFQDWDSLKALLRDDPGGSRTREIRVGPAWYEQRVYGDRREKSLRFYGFDISERKSAEKGLQENELRLKAVVENLPVGVWFADESGKILYGNPAGQKIWQGARYVPPEQFHEYKAWWAETGVRLQPEDWAVTRAVRKGEVSLNEILEIECFDGTRKTINNSAVPLFAGESRLFGVVVLNEDITERVSIQAELRRSETRFRLLAETAGRLLATAVPQEAVNEMCRDVMAFLDCQAFFNSWRTKRPGSSGSTPMRGSRKKKPGRSSGWTTGRPSAAAWPGTEPGSSPKTSATPRISGRS